MATTASRMSLDPAPSLDLPPLVNPLPNPHVRLPDPAPAVHSQTRRVSSESQAPGRASPSSKISRRTPVPFLLEAFPAPPSHIPGTPASLSPSTILSPSLLGSATSWAPGGSVVSSNPASPSSSNAVSPCSPTSVVAALPHNNPPPSSPPSAPLPPVPGPSSFSASHRALQSAVRSGSPALSMTEPRRSLSRSERRPRPSVEESESVHGRGRQGSLSSLRNPIYPTAERNEGIVGGPSSSPPLALDAPHSPPLFGSVAARKSHDQSRGDSPDILRSSLSRTATSPFLHPGDKPCVEDSIASVDMSDLNALKSDNEGDGDDQASHPFPRYPPHPRSHPQRPSDPSCSDPLYAHSPQKQSMSSVYSAHVSSTSEDMASRDGALSPEIKQMISVTPRPRKRSAPSRSRESSSTRNRKESAKSGKGVDVPPLPTSSQIIRSTAKSAAWLNREDEAMRAQDDGHESDSSLDLHTPLPQLMLRHGMLSPNSKLLPRSDDDRARLSIMSSSSYLSNASNLSLKSIASTCSKHAKDARDTPQRRVRHRDGKLLKGGIGLTTGLGWSDSEDEDAPSALTRRVSTLVLARRASSSSVGSYRSVRSQPIARSISHSVLREADEFEDENDADEFGYSNRSSLATRSLPSRTKPVSRVGSVRSAGSSTSLGRYSAYSISSAGVRTRAGSVSESSMYSDGHTGLMPGIREHDDGVTPTRAAFERSSLSSNGGSGADAPHTPSSTASSASLPFPATPEGSEEIPQSRLHHYDKTLPPLPPGARVKYPSIGLRPQIGGLQRPRVSSNASSLSNPSILGPPSVDVKSNTPSTASTPRQSLAERPAKPTIQTASSRPSLNGAPRPSLTIPKSPFPSQSSASGLPRPTTPSLPPASGYAPRPLRLVSRSSPLTSPTLPSNTLPHPSPIQTEFNQSPSKLLQPGEQAPRPGQVLTYNRNVHDQLKLRALSPSTRLDRTSGIAVSPGSAQPSSIPSPAIASSPDSAVSTSFTTHSQSPLPSPSLNGEGFRPKPRTGTGMMYRNNLSVGSVAASRIRVPSTVSR